MNGNYHDEKTLYQLAAKAGVGDAHWVKKMINSTLFLQDPKGREKLAYFLSLKFEQNVKADHPFLPVPPNQENEKNELRRLSR